MATAEVKHDYHLVDPSPWPIVGSVSVFIMAVGAVGWMKHLYSTPWLVFAAGAIGVRLNLMVQRSPEPGRAAGRND